jgi:hypothetical protein
MTNPLRLGRGCPLGPSRRNAALRRHQEPGRPAFSPRDRKARKPAGSGARRVRGAHERSGHGDRRAMVRWRPHGGSAPHFGRRSGPTSPESALVFAIFEWNFRRRRPIIKDGDQRRRSALRREIANHARARCESSENRPKGAGLPSRGPAVRGRLRREEGPEGAGDPIAEEKPFFPGYHHTALASQGLAEPDLRTSGRERHPDQPDPMQRSAAPLLSSRRCPARPGPALPEPVRGSRLHRPG